MPDIRRLGSLVGPLRAISGDGNRGELLICPEFCGFSVSCYDEEMRDLVILFVHLITTLVRLAGPGGVRSVVVMVEYKDLATLEQNEDKADALLQKMFGGDEKVMQGYKER